MRSLSKQNNIIVCLCGCIHVYMCMLCGNTCPHYYYRERVAALSSQESSSCSLHISKNNRIPFMNVNDKETLLQRYQPLNHMHTYIPDFDYIKQYNNIKIKDFYWFWREKKTIEDHECGKVLQLEINTRVNILIDTHQNSI